VLGAEDMETKFASIQGMLDIFHVWKIDLDLRMPEQISQIVRPWEEE
jgi:hypothetical protein